MRTHVTPSTQLACMPPACGVGFAAAAYGPRVHVTLAVLQPSGTVSDPWAATRPAEPTTAARTNPTTRVRVMCSPDSRGGARGSLRNAGGHAAAAQGSSEHTNPVPPRKWHEGAVRPAPKCRPDLLYEWLTVGQNAAAISPRESRT